MLIVSSFSPLDNLASTARTHAIAGAAAGVAVGVIHGVLAARQRRLGDRYDVATEALTHVGTGAVLGALAATTTMLAGVSIASIGARGVLSIAVPLVASTVATGSAHAPVERALRSWSGGLVHGLRRALQTDEDAGPA